MNPYQKAGVWLMRLVGGIVVVFGVMGAAYATVAKATGLTVQEYPPERWIGSIFWTIGGVAIVLAAKPIGRLLGRGLE